VIRVDDFVLFCDRTFDGYERALSRLDDEQLNASPTTGGCTAAQWVSHMLGAVRFWTAHVVCGQPSDRDRDAEFVAVASRAELLDGIAALRGDLAALRSDLAAATEVAFSYETEIPLGHPWTVGTALMHAYEELAQHLGHLEVTIDLVTSAR